MDLHTCVTYFEHKLQFKKLLNFFLFLRSLCLAVQHPLLRTSSQASVVFMLQTEGGGCVSVSGRVEKTIVPAPDRWWRADPWDGAAQTSRFRFHLTAYWDCFWPVAWVNLRQKEKWVYSSRVLEFCMLQQHRQLQSLTSKKWYIPPSKSWFKYAFLNLSFTYPSVYQWAAVFRSRRVNCWSSCNMWSCLRKKHWSSCRNSRTRLTDCCPQTPNLRRKPDSTRRDLTLTAHQRHTGCSGQVLKVRATKWHTVFCFGTLDHLRRKFDLFFFLVSVGWNNSRASWRQQPTYVSGVRFHKNFLNPATWQIFLF